MFVVTVVENNYFMRGECEMILVVLLFPDYSIE